MQALMTMILDERGSKAIDPTVFDIRRDWLLLDVIPPDSSLEPFLYVAQRTAPPRKFKTHVPFHLLPKSAVQKGSKASVLFWL